MAVNVYSISLHHKVYQFEWLFRALENAEDLFLVHVDRRAPEELVRQVRAIVSARPNVELLPRVAIRWGRWSQVRAELAAMRRAFELGTEWRYFITLSGQDYPIRSRAEIDAELAAGWPGSFLSVDSFEQIRLVRPQDRHLRKRLTVRIGGHLVETPMPVPAVPGVDAEFKGSSWHMLSRDFCQWVLTAPVPRRLERALTYSRCPDEVFFQACFMNSPFKDLHAGDARRFTRWSSATAASPAVLVAGDRPDLDDSDALFARKFDAQVDRSVLEALARDLGYPQPSAPSGVAR